MPTAIMMNIIVLMIFIIIAAFIRLVKPGMV